MKFIKPMLPKRESEGGQKKLRALDVGAGIGRITGALLLEICDTVRWDGLLERRRAIVVGCARFRSSCPLRSQVDLLEGAKNFVAKAKEALAWAGDRVERYMCEGMQDWVGEPGRRARSQRVAPRLACGAACRFVCAILHASPSCRYDVIWIQWCIGSLTDEDMVVFMERCKQARSRRTTPSTSSRVSRPSSSAWAARTLLSPHSRLLLAASSC